MPLILFEDRCYEVSWVELDKLQNLQRGVENNTVPEDDLTEYLIDLCKDGRKAKAMGSIFFSHRI